MICGRAFEKHGFNGGGKEEGGGIKSKNKDPGGPMFIENNFQQEYKSRLLSCEV